MCSNRSSAVGPASERPGHRAWCWFSPRAQFFHTQNGNQGQFLALVLPLQAWTMKRLAVWAPMQPGSAAPMNCTGYNNPGRNAAQAAVHSKGQDS